MNSANSAVTNEVTIHTNPAEDSISNCNSPSMIEAAEESSKVIFFYIFLMPKMTFCNVKNDILFKKSLGPKY